MKKIVLDDIFIVLKGLKHFFNFLKFSCGPPFGSASDVCGPPFGFRSKLLNLSKFVFMSPKEIFS